MPAEQKNSGVGRELQPEGISMCEIQISKFRKELVKGHCFGVAGLGERGPERLSELPMLRHLNFVP